MSKYSTFVLNKMSSSMFLKLYTLSCAIKKDGPIYGREILEYIHSFNIAWEPSHGTLYPILASMCEEGLIQFEYKYANRNFYSITDKGREYYNERAKDFKRMLTDSYKFYRAIAEELEV